MGESVSKESRQLPLKLLVAHAIDSKEDWGLALWTTIVLLLSLLRSLFLMLDGRVVNDLANGLVLWFLSKGLFDLLDSHVTDLLNINELSQ